MQKKLIIIFLLFGAIQNSVCAKLITSEKPFLVVTRSFPCSETVHKARFFYEQVKSLGQVQGKVFSFTAPSNKKVLEHFKSMQPRAKVFEPGAGKIRQLGVFLTSQVKALSASTGKRRSVSIKFEFESGKHEMSAVFWFVKRGSLVECDVYLQGYTHSVSSLVTNLIRAIICDDSMLSKHWGKGVLTVAAAGLVVGLSQRRTKDESKPEAAPISIDSFKNQLHQSLVTLLTGFNSPSSLYFNDNNGKAVSVAIGTEFKPVQEKTLFNSVQIAFAVDAQAAEAFTCASSRRKCSDAGYDFKFIDQNFVVLQGDLDSVVLISHQGKQVFNDMGLLLQELSKKIESDVRAITVAKNAETMVEQSIFAGKFPRAFSEIPEDVKLGVELLPPYAYIGSSNG